MFSAFRKLQSQQQQKQNKQKTHKNTGVCRKCFWHRRCLLLEFCFVVGFFLFWALVFCYCFVCFGVPPLQSPRYNRTGCLGVKHQLTYLLPGSEFS